MKISPETVVTLTYELYVEDPETTPEEELYEMIEAVTEDQPLVFIHSISGLPTGFEKELLGLSPGDTFDFWIEPEEGYGDYDEDALASFPLDMFVDEMGDRKEELLEVGTTLPFVNDEGEQLTGQIVEITPTEVIVDFNHPLAGRTMHFEGKVLDVRPATPSELEHGHVHGPGGIEH